MKSTETLEIISGGGSVHGSSSPHDPAIRAVRSSPSSPCPRGSGPGFPAACGRLHRRWHCGWSPPCPRRPPRGIASGIEMGELADGFVRMVRVAAATSDCRIRLSPMRNALTRPRKAAPDPEISKLVTGRSSVPKSRWCRWRRSRRSRLRHGRSSRPRYRGSSAHARSARPIPWRRRRRPAG